VSQFEIQRSIPLERSAMLIMQNRKIPQEILNQRFPHHFEKAIGHRAIPANAMTQIMIASF
jgi:hypothetical protein